MFYNLFTNLGEIMAASSLSGLGSGVMVKEAVAGMGAGPEASEEEEGERGGVLEAGAEGRLVRGPLSLTVL